MATGLRSGKVSTRSTDDSADCVIARRALRSGSTAHQRRISEHEFAGPRPSRPVWRFQGRLEERLERNPESCGCGTTQVLSSAGSSPNSHPIPWTSGLQLLLEVEPRQPAAGLLGRHCLGNLGSYLAKPAPAVEAVRRSLNLGGANQHLAEAERAGQLFRTFEHAFGKTGAAELLVEIHPA